MQPRHGTGGLLPRGSQAMAQNEELLKTLYEQAANERDSRLMELVKAITILLDAKQQQQPATRTLPSD